MNPVGAVIGGTLAFLGASSLQSSSLYVSGQQIWAEWTAWGVIALACRLRSHYITSQTYSLVEDEKTTQQPTRRSKLQALDKTTLIAFCLVTAQCIGLRVHEAQLAWAFPLVTLLAFVLTALWRPSQSQNSDSDPDSIIRKILPASLGRRCDHGASAVLTIATCIASAFVLLPQTNIITPSTFALGTIYAILMAAAYVFVSRMSNDDSSNGSNGTKSSRFIGLVESISIRAFAMCTLYLALSSTPVPRLRFLILIFAVMRFVQLFASLALCFLNVSVAAATIFTVSTSIAGGILSSAQIPKSLHLLLALAALVQAHTSIPKTQTSRAWLFVLLFIPFIRLLVCPEAGLVPYPNSQNRDAPFGRIHPVQKLAESNQKRFEVMLAGQSTTVEEAVKEYKRRYGRKPPPGFDRWFEIAQEKDFLFIDEFDTIMESLEPFWGISPSALRQRVKSLENAEWISAVKVGKHDFEHIGDHYHVDFMQEWMNRTVWGNVIPETNFVISTLDEPRIVAPFDTMDLAMQRAVRLQTADTPKIPTSSKQKPKANDVKWISVGQQDAWEAMLSSCHIDSPARSELAARSHEHHSLFPFVSNTTANIDVCNSADLLNHHGFLASPDSLKITHSLVPVFSQCKPSIFNDILYPSPYYQMQITSGDYNEDEDPSWDEKIDRLYWSGAGTGGYTTTRNWMDMHRQRLTMMVANDNGRTVNLLEKDGEGNWQPRMTTWSDISSMFYLRITGVCQCSEEACEAQIQRFNVTEEKEEKSAALLNKYALDIDGNTFSGRFYRLLKSNAAVLKHTVFKEWHDGRLIPWVHYIPVSTGAEELGELMRFLTQEEEGKVIGSKIASQGREWARKTLRTEDLEIVFIRVLMEYARIINDARDTLGYGRSGN